MKNTFPPHRLHELTQRAEVMGLSIYAQNKLRWIIRYVQSGKNISEFCDELNIARSTFHRWLDKFDPEHLELLEECSHEAKKLRTSIVDQNTVELIRAMRQRSTTIGKEAIRQQLLNAHAIEISASSIGRIIERECMYYGNSPLHWRKRMAGKLNQLEEATATASEKERIYSHDQQECIETTSGENKIKVDTQFFTLKINKHFIKRLLLTMSLLLNAAVISMYVFTVQWEKREQELRAELQITQTEPLSNLDSLSLHDER